MLDLREHEVTRVISPLTFFVKRPPVDQCRITALFPTRATEFIRLTTYLREVTRVELNSITRLLLNNVRKNADEGS